MYNYFFFVVKNQGAVIIQKYFDIFLWGITDDSPFSVNIIAHSSLDF